jgi:hypothetical protein
MTLKEIEEHFRIEKYREGKNKFLVFSNIPGSCNRMVYKYLCLIQRHGQKFFVNGFEPTNDIDVLKSQIEQYVASLKYDSGYFNPHFIKGLTEELIIHDYLSEIGFENPRYSNGDVYRPSGKNIYGYISNDITISFFGLDRFDGYRYNKDNSDDPMKEVTISLSTGQFSWISVKTKREVESIKEGIDSLLKPLLVTESVNSFSMSEKLENATMDMDILLEKLTDSLDGSTEDFKSTLKSRLLEIADKM